MNSSQIVSAQEMRQLDKLTITTNNITSFQLMKQASKAMYQYALKENLLPFQGDILVVAGTGNNGGDALLIGQYASEAGATVHYVVVGDDQNRSDESLEAELEVKSKSHNIHHLHSIADVDHVQHLFDQASIIIDGLFGIGLSRDIEGLYYHTIERINQSYATTISIDIPSGLHADNGLVLGTAVHADHTFILQNYKQGNLLNDALDYHGKHHLVDVGILQVLFEEPQTLLTHKYLHNKLPKRQHNSHKYHFGNVITVGGSKGMMGAPIMAGYSALRTGTGLSHVLYHEQYLPHIHSIYPELMINTYFGIEEIPQLVHKKTAIIFGPGLGRKDDINLEVLKYMLSTDIPIVIDADGIFYLKQLLNEYSERTNIVITPHYKEMADFLGITVSEVMKEPVLYAKNIAHTYNLTVVLKGTCTIITNNDETYFTIEGNPGLATAGSGDVLSGIIGSLLGRQLAALEAAILGVMIHTKAALYAMEEYGEESMIATDVTSHIPTVLNDAKL